MKRQQVMGQVWKQVKYQIWDQVENQVWDQFKNNKISNKLYTKIKI